MGDVIRAVVQTGPRQLEMREFPRPVIGPDDGGLLRVEACGICGSDVEQYRGQPEQPVAADGARARAARDHRGGQRLRGRPLGGPARRPGGGGDPHPVPVLRPVPGRAVHVVPSPDRESRGLQSAGARARPVGRLLRVHPPAPERDPAQGARRHPGRGRGDVQPAGRGRALGRAPGRGGARGHRADPRRGAAGPRRRAGRPDRGGRDDHRDRAWARCRQAGAGAGVRRGSHDRRRGRGHRVAGPRYHRRGRGRHRARADADGPRSPSWTRSTPSGGAAGWCSPG